MKFVSRSLFPALLLAAAAFLSLKTTTMPVASAHEATDAPKSPPIAANEQTFLSGAHIYREQCAFCHGLKEHDSAIGPLMSPHAPQLWRSHRAGVVGVSDDPPSETYGKVSDGIPHSGMPAFSKTLDETQMWQVSLLVANADKTLPPAVEALLKQPLPVDSK